MVHWIRLVEKRQLLTSSPVRLRALFFLSICLKAKFLDGIKFHWVRMHKIH